LPSVADYCRNFICIAKGSDGISTAEAYKQYDLKKDIIHPDVQFISESLKNKKFSDTFDKFGNVFEQLISCDDVNFIKNTMSERKAYVSMLTGSGSAVFGIFKGMKEAEKCAEFFKNKNFFADICTFKNCGSEIV
jgi:4-diphosphocytidyl-2-C-methyl-D-erythritol kinase